MSLEISLLPNNKKHVLKNMLELYLYDICEFNDSKTPYELNNNGLCGYKYFENYCSELGRFPYVARMNDRLVGFALIRTINEKPPTFEVAEFFIMKKYRCQGVGGKVASGILSKHKGHWIIETSVKNTVAQNFWRGTIKMFSCVNCEETEIECNGKRKQWKFNN